MLKRLIRLKSHDEVNVMAEDKNEESEDEESDDDDFDLDGEDNDDKEE